MGLQGDGITPEGVFVPYALPGEIIEADMADGRGRITTVLQAARDRVEPACGHFTECGGCALQHWRTDAYRAWKREAVRTALKRAGVAVPVKPLVNAHGAGRRRVGLQAVRSKATGFVFGFSKAESRHVVDITACPIVCPPIAQAWDGLRALAEAALPRAGRLGLHVTASDAGLDVRLDGAGAPDLSLRQTLAEHAEALDLARLSVGDEPVWSARAPRIAMGRAQVEPPPGGFLQPTEAGEAELWALVEAGLADAQKPVDLYCGVGTFALRLAERVAVRAIEGDPQAVAALKAAAKADGLKPIYAERRDLARMPLSPKELDHYDAVVLDPPRAGAAAQVQALAKSRIGRVVMVSCNPATFARDAAHLINAGFALGEVTPVDQFLYSNHVELAGVFTR